MGSSGSTLSPRRNAALRLLVVLAREDHPKACTGRRLLHWGRVVRVVDEDASTPPPVVLDPYSPVPLSGADRGLAQTGGLLVVDCSWNRLSSRGTFPGSPRKGRRHGTHRRLPFLIATNPQHYGRLAQLTTVEAFTAALYVLGREEEAKDLIAGFAGGDEFFEVNRARLDRYREATVPSDITAAEKALFGGT
jgi:pre-rRNA-processing protein TSR3